MSPMLECTGLSVRFGGVVAVDDISVSVDAGGEVVGLIGPNGSGKSTFLNAVSGLVPAKGRVTVDGKPVPLGRPGAIAKHGVFRTYQTPQVDAMVTCMENVLVSSPDQAMRGLIGAWPLRPAMWTAREEALAVGLQRPRAGGPARAGQHAGRRALLR